jgi:hypothetical protein
MAAEAIGDRQSISHVQAHEESSMVSRLLLTKALESKLSIVLDERIDTSSDVADLIAIAREQGLSVRTLDIDASLETSALTVLSRKVGGAAPNVPFDAIAEGYRGIRESRGMLIEEVRDNPKISDYVLYAPDATGKLVKVAEKAGGGELIVVAGREDLFQSTTDKNSDVAAAQVGRTAIDDNYIESVISKTPDKFKVKSRAVLERYKGKTLKEALDLNAQQINPD